MKKILGVGTALVDVICQVDDNIISELNLSKGSMTLIEESQIQNIRLLPNHILKDHSLN